MEHGSIAIPSTFPPCTLRFDVDDTGNVTFIDPVPVLLRTSIPSMVDTIRENRGLPNIKRVYQGAQAPQWR